MQGDDRHNWRISRPHLWLIRLIGVIVPRRLRADWRQEWEAELRCRETLLAEWDKLDWRNKLDLLRRSAGAFLDALYLQPRRLEDEMFQDLRYGARMLRRNPGFTAVVVLTLSLGIGANTAIFSLADALLLRPLPAQSPAEIVTINTTSPENPFLGVSYPDFQDLRAQSRSFAGMVAYKLSMLGVAKTAESSPQMKMGMLVSEDFFRILGAPAAIGRDFFSEETKVAGRDAVVILSYGFWSNEFGADKDVIGRAIRLNGVPFTVVGVAPEEFTGLHPMMRPALYLPLTMSTRLYSDSAVELLEQRDRRDLNVKGRLRAGVSIESAQAELATLAKALEQSYPDTNLRKSATVRSELRARAQDSPSSAAMVALLLALVGLVLIIACANVANLLLARGRARVREIAIRLAIGAGRARLIRQLLTESVLLAFMGGGLGVVFAYAINRYLRSIPIPTDVPLVLSLRLDGRVLLFTLAASMLSALAFGLAPAWQAVKINLVPALQAAAPSTSGRNRMPGRNALVVGQVALSLTLLVVAGTLYEAFNKMVTLDPGFRTDRTMMMEFDPTLIRYSAEQTREFYRQLTDRVRALPGVRSAALSRAIPFRPSFTDENVAPEGYQFPPGQESVTMLTNVVDERYFETMKTDLVRGRGFTAADTVDSRRVGVVNEEFSKRYWPNQDPVGKRFRLGVAPNKDGEWIEVVGVARTGKYLSIAEAPRPYIYLPLAQNLRTRMVLLVETAGDPRAIAEPLRREALALDANMPIFNFRTLETH
jgi:macrolide transport system ATP-binding/permease protein